jgi:hypothetical protein
MISNYDKWLTNEPNMKNKTKYFELKKGNFVWVKEPFFKERRMGKVVEVRGHDLFYVNVYGFDYSNKTQKFHEIHIELLECFY